MGVTDDPNDPRLGRGVDESPTGQHQVYLVLSHEKRAKGFVRPYRDAYRHVGPAGPGPWLRDLTEDEKARYSGCGYAKYEEYPQPNPSGSSVVGRFWTQAQLDAKGCGTETRMGRELSETYARDPKFYGATYCVACQMHLPVSEFVWVVDGTRVGS